MFLVLFTNLSYVELDDEVVAVPPADIQPFTCTLDLAHAYLHLSCFTANSVATLSGLTADH